jgi:hypothetical protein
VSWGYAMASLRGLFRLGHLAECGECRVHVVPVLGAPRVYSHTTPG